MSSLSIKYLQDQYDWHARKLQAHLTREPFTESLLDEDHARAEMKRIADRIIEKGGPAPEPIPVEADIRGMETSAVDSFAALGDLVNLHRRQGTAALEAGYGDNSGRGLRRELEQQYNRLAAQVTEAYAAGAEGVETGHPAMEAERQLDEVTIRLMTGTRPEPEPEAEAET